MTDAVDWAAIPARQVPVGWLVWPCHDIDPAHTHPVPGLVLQDGPIHVERLATGHLFVHDGRHRAIRAQIAGQPTILAKVHRDPAPVALRGEHGPELAHMPPAVAKVHRDQIC